MRFAMTATGGMRTRSAILSLVAALCLGQSSCERKETLPAYDSATAVHQRFSGAAALQLATEVTSIGPRPAGSEALEKSRQWIADNLAASGWKIQRQTLVEPTPQGEIEFVNIRARHAPTAGTEVNPEEFWRRPTDVLLASHYDTKFYQGIEFVGANDPGSSIGALLEMARVLATRPELARHCELVFFDGEECFVSYSPSDGLFGSRYYARQYRKWPEEMQFKAAVLLDLVGDRDLNIRIPRNSPPQLTAQLFAAADELGTRSFFGSSGKEITDDHVPLNGAGLPTIDVIDLDYPYWHTSADTIDKLSGDSLEIVGQTVLLMVEKYLLRGKE